MLSGARSARSPGTSSPGGSACRRRRRTPSSAGSTGAGIAAERRRCTGTRSCDKVVLPMVLLAARRVPRSRSLLMVGRAVARAELRARPHACAGSALAQTASAAAMALGHGLQDAQKTMGVIVLALVAGGFTTSGDAIPLWVKLVRGHGDLAGHLLRRLAHHAHARPQDHRARPGPRLRRRVGRRVGAVRQRVLAARARSRPRTRSPRRSWASAPPSALSAVRWGVAKNIAYAWVLTIPAAAARRPPASTGSSTRSST